MSRVSDIVRRMFRRAVRPQVTPTIRTRLNVEEVESRIVPVVPQVTAGWVSDAWEGGTEGVIEILRTAPTTSALTVNYSVGGTTTLPAQTTPR
jgi:hypothetical protein